MDGLGVRSIAALPMPCITAGKKPLSVHVVEMPFRPGIGGPAEYAEIRGILVGIMPQMALFPLW